MGRSAEQSVLGNLAASVDETAATTAETRSELVVMPVVPLLDWVAFPEMAMPLQASRDASLAAVAAAETRGGRGVRVAQRRASDKVRPSGLFEVGT
ncbi:MAG: hypothetical protein OXF96_08520, partial [Chloroflexi bacterium]|nr:hypothetical protein [Chloroflexota bacterium]